LNIVFYAICAVPMALTAMADSRSPWTKMAVLALIVVSLLACVFTLHRTGLVVVLIQLCGLIILRRKHLWALVLISVAVILAAYQLDRIRTIYTGLWGLVTGDLSAISFRGREANWMAFLRSLFNAHPFYWFIGRGVSDATAFMPAGYVLSAKEPHNDFIRILHLYGIIGLGLYIVMLGKIAAIGIRLSQLRDSFCRGLGNVILLLLLGVVILSVTTEPSRYPAGVWYLIALGSIGEAQYRHALLGRVKGCIAVDQCEEAIIDP
jgi:O-antigen ligase